jgi:flagellar biosynthesis protein FlhF
MKPKHFLGRDMSEALSAVRKSLGPDALILESRSVAAGNGMGVEVTAMNDEADGIRGETVNRGSGESENRRESDAGPLKEVQEGIAEVRALLHWILPGVARKGLAEKLLDQGLSPEVITRLARAMEGIEAKGDRERIFAALSRLIPCAEALQTKAGKQQRLALIGPTGVGKTTSIIKLTVRLLQKARRVGWISLESGRSVGADLLASYCGILDVPYRAAHDRTSLEQAFDQLSSSDCVLLDTPGFSPRDESGVEELTESLDAVSDLKRMLLLSAATNGRDMADWVEVYRKIGLDSLVFTKVDECRYFGPLINTAIVSGLPLAYVTGGQDLVNDLQVGRPELLANLVLSGWSNDD